MSSTTEIAVFGGGCFWCTEAVFEDLHGVVSVMPGYAGGHTSNPTYEAVCTGETGHAEVLRVLYEPDQISYQDLLTVFFASHNPTTKNRQGNDVGTEYRSLILTTSEKQREEAEAFIKELNKDPQSPPAVTEVESLTKFFEAEAYHHHYFKTHPDQAYCQFVINPKMEKVRARFQALLKK